MMCVPREGLCPSRTHSTKGQWPIGPSWSDSGTSDSGTARAMPSAACSGSPGWAAVSIFAGWPSTLNPGGFRGGPWRITPRRSTAGQSPVPAWGRSSISPASLPLRMHPSGRLWCCAAAAASRRSASCLAHHGEAPAPRQRSGAAMARLARCKPLAHACREVRQRTQLPISRCRSGRIRVASS